MASNSTEGSTNQLTLLTPKLENEAEGKRKTPVSGKTVKTFDLDSGREFDIMPPTKKKKPAGQYNKQLKSGRPKNLMSLLDDAVGDASPQPFVVPRGGVGPLEIVVALPALNVPFDDTENMPVERPPVVFVDLTTPENSNSSAGN